MLFNSYAFLIFFPIVVLLYFALPAKLQRWWLLICSYYFYMCWDAKYIVLLLYATCVTYCAGRFVEKVRDTKYKKAGLVISISMCLLVLVLFKYTTFLISSINGIIVLFHGAYTFPIKNILLPMGISFYTFQALSYVIDVYRGNIEAEKSMVNYALYISFFPQLVAGPIERSKNLLTQIHKVHIFDYYRMRDGLIVMLWGYFMKLVIADRAAVIVDTVYGNYTEYHGMHLIVATILFAVQIYCDFGGYSMIAIGAAQVMGFELMENFNCPYFAQTVDGFWRRWHISLTSWFKDYVYIPLGGNRKGQKRKELNKLIVFLLSGLWHGAEWSFVIWGGLNGLYQVIGEKLLPVRTFICKKLGICVNTVGHKLLKVFTTFLLIDFAWIFFRADTVKDALWIVKDIFTTWNPWVLFDQSIYEMGLNRQNVQLLWIAIFILIFADALKYKRISVRETIIKQHLVYRWIFYLVALFFVIIFGWYGSDYGSSFIYFQF